MESNRRNSLFMMVTVLLLWPCVAQANAGTPLLWGEFLHLTGGNVLIGFMEGLLLYKLFKLERKGRCIEAMVLANFFSAWIGFLGLQIFSEFVIPWTIENAKRYLCLLVIACWLVSVLLEYPFVMFIFGWKKWQWTKALHGSLVVQTISYMVLVGWYLLCGSSTLLTRCTVVKAADIKLPENICIYYFAKTDDAVHRLHVGQDDDTAIAKPEIDIHEPVRAKLVAMTDGPKDTMASLKIIVVDDRTTYRKPRIGTVLPNFAEAGKALLELPDDRGVYRHYQWQWLGRTLGVAKDSDVRFQTGFWPQRGMYLMEREKSPEDKLDYDQYGFAWREWTFGKKLIALEMPFLSWTIRNIIQLPGDFVLFELDRDQICLFDYKTMRIALVARGFGATAVVE